MPGGDRAWRSATAIVGDQNFDGSKICRAATGGCCYATRRELDLLVHGTWIDDVAMSSVESLLVNDDLAYSCLPERGITCILIDIWKSSVDIVEV